VDGALAWILRRDADVLTDAALDASALAPRLLPAFDTYLLAHAAKGHLIEPHFYKRVYRAQGWLSPVVIVGGRVVAVWLLEERARVHARRPPVHQARRAHRTRHRGGSRRARPIPRRPLHPSILLEPL
jgi:DNA glycosylase AlkZ-like